MYGWCIMLEVVEFDDGTFGLRNRYTGNILTQDDDKPRTFATLEQAQDEGAKEAVKFEKMLTNLLAALDKEENRNDA